MSRETILAKVKQATQVIAEKAAYPDYDVTDLHSAPRLEGTGLWEIFSRNFRAVNGKTMRSLDELVAFLQSTQQTNGYCDPVLWDAVVRACCAMSQGVQNCGVFALLRDVVRCGDVMLRAI